MNNLFYFFSSSDDSNLWRYSVFISIQEHVLHHVMLIFAFMGSQLLQQDDSHSFHIITTTITTIIPALLKVWRKHLYSETTCYRRPPLSKTVLLWEMRNWFHQNGLFHWSQPSVPVNTKQLNNNCAMLDQRYTNVFCWLLWKANCRERPLFPCFRGQGVSHNRFHCIPV